MNAMQGYFTAGILRLHRPSASSTPRGKATAIPMTEISIVSMSPPLRSMGTVVRPSHSPPCRTATSTKGAAPHIA